MKGRRHILLLLAAGLMLGAVVSCVRDDEWRAANVPSRSAEAEVSLHLMYCAAHKNGLASDIRRNIDSLRAGDIPDTLNGRDVFLVYFHGQTGTPTLSRIYRDPSDGQVHEKVLITYPDTVHSSASWTVKKVWEDALGRYPSPHRGFIFSSHGTGWIPVQYYSPGYTPVPTTTGDVDADTACTPEAESYGTPDESGRRDFKSLGQEIYGFDLSYEMEIVRFARHLPKLDYIILDACLMGCVEVAYELKDRCDWILCSPAEILTSGFCYKPMAGQLQRKDYEGICRSYYEMYNARSGYLRSGIVTLVDCSKLEALARLCRRLFRENRIALDALGVRDAQQYFRNQNPLRSWFYDLRDLLVKSGLGEEDQMLLARALKDCIPYTAHTPTFYKPYASGFDCVNCCGLSCYLPAQGTAELSVYYRNYRWNTDTGLVE